MRSSRLRASVAGRGASRLDDGVPCRFLPIGLAVGLVAAALSLAACSAATGATGPRTAAGSSAALRGELPADGGTGSTSAEVGPDLVPPGLAGRTWLVRGPSGDLVAGVAGRSGRLRIPGEERPLAVGDGLVATVGPDGAGSLVSVRELATGRIVLSVERVEEVLTGVFAGGTLVVGGHLPGTDGRDPGLVAISLADGSVRTLIEPSSVPDFAGDLARTVAVSPSGRTLVSGVCGLERCALDVVDLAAGGTRRIVGSVEGFPGAVTDAIVVVGDAESSWIAGVDLATGERRWTRDEAEFAHAYAMPDGTIVQAVISAERGTFALERIDPETGAGRSLLVRDAAEGLTLWPELSDARTAVLGIVGTFADVAGASREVRAAVVDLGSGELRPNGLVLDVEG